MGYGICSFSEIMKLRHFNSILTSAVILISTVTACASVKVTPSKSPDLQQATYCADEAKLQALGTISHLDERNSIDRIVISKKDKKLYLLSQGRLYKTYSVAFGFGYADGNKVQSGDGRTPEGIYKVELKKEKSEYHKALRVSYPNAYDKAFAKKQGVETGGDIMIHGFKNKETVYLQNWALDKVHPLYNWTEGCVAVTNAEIDEIFSIVAVNTAIEICPL